jgi:hypothetical protein
MNLDGENLLFVLFTFETILMLKYRRYIQI